MALQELIEPQTRPVVWAPIPGSSQELAVDSRCQHTFYTGTRGPGKTDAQLMKFRRRVGLGYGAFWRGVIFDREYKHLDDLVAKSKRWFNRFNDGAQWQSSTAAYKWVWPTGEELLFRVIKKIDDYDSYHGQEYPFIGWNELTKYPNCQLYDMMMSCNRSSFTPEKDSPRDENGKPILPDIPLEVFATGNSYGPGHGWVKTRFIDCARYGEVLKKDIEVFNPRSQATETITRTQVTLFGTYKENIYLSPVYIAGLQEMTETNENLRKSWLEGDWEVVAGGAVDDVWKKAKHVLPRFQIPANWHIDRSFDWGSSHPFSVGWWAEANGEEVDIQIGDRIVKFAPPRGSLIQIAEWYGTKVLQSNKGIKLSAPDIAYGIRERELFMLKAQWILRQPSPGPADNQIRDVRETDEETIEKKMADRGVRWQVSDKSPGSRRNGLELVRNRLEAVLKREGAGLYFMSNCVASITLIPVLPRDEVQIDDVDTEAEDHTYDMVRYRVLKGSNRIATKVKVSYPRSA